MFTIFILEIENLRLKTFPTITQLVNFKMGIHTSSMSGDPNSPTGESFKGSGERF